MTLWSCIKDALLRNPTQRVREKQTAMQYEDLAAYSEMFAQKLIGEKCCAILCDSEMAAAKALLSCFAAGVTAVPLSSRYGERHCQKILDMVCPTALITDTGGTLKVTRFFEPTYHEPREGHPALIMCTSGTTGTPKGAMLSEKNILTNLHDISAYFGIDQEDAILIARPLYHCAVLTGEFLVSLFKGCEILFCSDPFNPKALLDLIDENKITVFCGTPTLFRTLARFRRENAGHTLKHICISGECMSEETGRYIKKVFPHADIYHAYGLTEACPRVSFLFPEAFHLHPGSVGMPLGSVSLKIVKDNGETAAVDEEGVLWVRGDNVMLGYYNAPEQTEKVLKNGWLCTGDIAVMDSEGLLTIKGRSDDLIIRAGMNIYPQEVESALKCDPRVREVLVYGSERPHTGVQVALKISGDFADVGEVKQLCMEVLPPFQMPTHIELLDELPKNGSGKIIRGVRHA